MKSGLLNAGLGLISLVFSLLVMESFFRTSFPRYRHAVDSQMHPNQERRWSFDPNTTALSEHPDNGKPIRLFRNNLSLRHDRDIELTALNQTENIVFFGDSFLDNIRLPGPYIVGEVLDYLLNQSGTQPFNVLNYGVSGYGTDQSYLYYRSNDIAKKAKHVVYFFCANDLTNNYANALFELDEKGELFSLPAKQSNFLVRALSKIHTTYFFIELNAYFKNWLSNEQAKFQAQVQLERQVELEFQRKALAERTQSAHMRMLMEMTEAARYDQIPEAWALFEALLTRWQDEVHQNGGKFYVVLLPRAAEGAIEERIKDRFDTINLYAAFKKSVPNYNYDDFHFKNNWHWDERGNLEAAVHLFRKFEEVLERKHLPEEKLKQLLHRYYASIPAGFKPDRWTAETELEESTRLAIQQRYLPLWSQ